MRIAGPRLAAAAAALALATGVMWLVALRGGERIEPAAPAAPSATLPAVGAPAAPAGSERPPGERVYFDVVGHSPEQVTRLLRRAEQLHRAAVTADRPLQVTFVLHGPDLDLFANDNYPRYRDIVDLAARLDAFGVFDFKACATTAERRGLDADAFPAFIEMVPYAPDYIGRLEQNGYISF